MVWTQQFVKRNFKMLERTQYNEQADVWECQYAKHKWRMLGNKLYRKEICKYDTKKNLLHILGGEIYTIYALCLINKF